ncbi:hypothetical protein [Flavobacterium sp. KACC 22763]|uniref:hypothetical protein n=1 Tax=Flavobacterium sp. KACC 22763 TaxID=3025668 RepID=UPI002366C980|nr:hypothetical protein [Flavobacterium sp. KACC 22763]WDF66622.1 hypothetical protein PQ463_10730 [Flavobacterium sp. KACC 22763]
MKEFFKENMVVSWLILISIFTCLIPITFYVIKFSGLALSDDPIVWGTFGDFLGGTINTILSLSSLVILAILTSSINKQSNAENKKNSFLLRRLDSFDQLASYLDKIGQITVYVSTVLNENKVTKKLSDEHDILKLKEYRHTLIEITVYLESFRHRYGHLYEYDFYSIEYIDLLKCSDKFKDLFDSIILIINGRDNNKEIIGDDYEKFTTKFDQVLKNLSKELK